MKGLPDCSITNFYRICDKCAEPCPSNANTFIDQKEIDGAFRWQIKQGEFFTLWRQSGTFCSKCMRVYRCPFQDNLMPDLVCKGIQHSAIFRRAAPKADDNFYGLKYPAKPLPVWMEAKS
jgi:hypothetical protein